MISDKDKIERIMRMEQHLDVVKAAVCSLNAALDQWEAALPSYAALSEYYSSAQWRLDFADDEAGRWPQGLRRGVLSEDGAWNALDAWREAKDRMHVLLGTEE